MEMQHYPETTRETLEGQAMHTQERGDAKNKKANTLQCIALYDLVQGCLVLSTTGFSIHRDMGEGREQGGQCLQNGVRPTPSKPPAVPMEW